jgi:hypothetical protein
MAAIRIHPATHARFDAETDAVLMRRQLSRR